MAPNPDLHEVVQYVKKQMDADAKTTALKTLQVVLYPTGTDSAATCIALWLCPV